MDETTKQALIHAALAMRSTADMIVALLTGEVVCPHAHKQDLTAFGEPEHWTCLDCGYEYQESPE